jgi:hypothetical protein
MARKYGCPEYEDLSIWHLNNNEIDFYLGHLEQKNNEWGLPNRKSLTEEEENHYIELQTRLCFNIKENDPRFDRFMECIRLRQGDYLALKNFQKRVDKYAELFFRLINNYPRLLH